MFNVIAWIIFGAVAGWLASILTGRNAQMGCLANIIVGILGAVIGGWLVNLLLPGSRPVVAGFDLYSIIVAVLGAVLLISLLGLFRPRRYY